MCLTYILQNPGLLRLLRITTKKGSVMKRLKGLFAISIMGLAVATGAFAQDRDNYRGDRNDSYRQQNQDQGERWRVRRNGRYYNLRQNQAEMLRQAVNEGYRQGFQAGRSDRTGRHRSGYMRSSIYREGTYGYDSSVDRRLYQYYFQQGFQKGYNDGYSSRFRYGRDDGGSVSILSNIVESILGLRRY